MNLHDIVAGPIGTVNAHETIKVYTCTGTTNVKGVVTPSYTVSERRAQIQAPGESDIRLVDKLAEADHRIKVWINAPASTINRVTQSAGDMLQRADGTYWLIVGVKEDFSPEGWLCVYAILQTEAPAFVEEVTDNASDTESDIVGS